MEKSKARQITELFVKENGIANDVNGMSDEQLVNIANVDYTNEAVYMAVGTLCHFKVNNYLCAKQGRNYDEHNIDVSYDTMYFARIEYANKYVAELTSRMARNEIIELQQFNGEFYETISKVYGSGFDR